MNVRNRRLALAAAVLALWGLLTGCSSLIPTIQREDVQGEEVQREEIHREDVQEIYAQDGYGEGRMGDVMHSYFFDFTVNSAYLCDEFEGYVPSQEGYRLLVTDVTVHNTHISSIPMFDSDFQVQWSSDAADAFELPITYEADQVSARQLPTEYELAVDEEREGLLVFEVPQGEKDFSISYLEVFDDSTEGDVFFVFFTAEEKENAAAI